MDLPLKALMKSKGTSITVRLKNNQEFRGRLRETDAYMNLLLDDCSELAGGNVLKRLGQAFLRGNNILLIKLH